MTSDDERWERDLRMGLSALLDDVRPGQPPVAAVLRKGRAMRLSRRLAVAGGAVVATAAVVAIVPALRGGGQPPAPRVGKAGVIAFGTIQGHTWRIVVDQRRDRLCAGEVGLRQSCVELRHLEHLSGPASLSGTVVDVKLRQPGDGSNGPPIWNGLFGIVTGGSGGNGWDAFVEAGPWGFCVSLNAPVPDGAQQNCWSPASLRARSRVIMRGGSPPAVPRWIVGAAGPSVAYLRMTLANGRSVKVRVDVFSGQGFYAMQIGPGPAIVRWSAYDAAGHRLYGGVGAPDGGS